MKVWGAMLALLCAVPAPAQDQPPAEPNYASMSEGALRARIREFETRRSGDQCVYAAMIAELTRRGPATLQATNMSRLAQASCYATREDYASAVTLLEEIDASLPQNRLERFGVYISSMAKDGDKTLKWLRRTVQFGSLPELMQREPSGTTSAFRLLLQVGLKREHNALCADIARADWFDGSVFELQNWCAEAALAHEIEAGELSQVPRLLGYVRMPEAYLSMLASREFEAAWPQIEEYAGDHLDKVTASFISWTAQRLADDPDDRDRLSLYANALLFAGRDEEAAVLASDWLAVATRGGELQEGDAWALEVRARALDSLGRTAEADAVFERLVMSRPDEPWMVNFVINRAIRLRSQRRWQEALDAFDIARTAADREGTDYARLLVAAGRACTLHQLGRDAEAELAYLVEHSKTYLPVAAGGLLCAQRREDAERMIAEAFEREDSELLFKDSIQDDRFDMQSFDSLASAPGTAEPPGVRTVILERADLRAKLLERVRLLPDHLVPIGYIRRQQRHTN